MHATFGALVLYHSLSRPYLLWPGQYVSFRKAASYRLVYNSKELSSNAVCKNSYSLLPNPRYSLLLVLLFAICEHNANALPPYTSNITLKCIYVVKPRAYVLFQSLHNTILIPSLQQRRSVKERKEQHSVSANSLSHSNSKSSTQSNISDPVKMSQNPSNIYDLTRGAGGTPINPSAYRADLELDNPQSGSTSGSSGSQNAQNSASNTSGQQGTNNQGDNSTAHPQSYGGSTPSSNIHPGSPMGTWQAQTRGQEPWTPPSAAGTGQGGAQGGGHGGGNAAAGRGGYQNGNAGSMSAARGSSTSGR